MRPIVLTGAAQVQTGAGSAKWSANAATAENASITRTQAGSIVIAGGIGIGTGTWTPTGGIATLGSAFVDATPNNSCIIGTSLASPTPSPGAATMGWTISPSCDTNGVLLEILPAAQLLPQQERIRVPIVGPTSRKVLAYYGR
jgi:hypothetical protein